MHPVWKGVLDIIQTANLFLHINSDMMNLILRFFTP